MTDVALFWDAEAGAADLSVYDGFRKGAVADGR